MLQDKTGQHVPSVTFVTKNDDGFKHVTTDDLFKDKTVVVFSLPGAFTPTCSSTHLPRYNQLAGALKQNGVDDIICMSVNDCFVMNAWSADQEAENITVIPDGNGEFNEQMGLLVDKSEIGFGKRSWRYSMLVKNGVIEKMFIEPEKDGDPFEVSDADTMLNYINPSANVPKSVALFTKPGCPYCAKAKALLKDKGYPFEEISFASGIGLTSLKAVTGRDTVPQVYIDGKHIGGSDDLETYFAS